MYRLVNRQRSSTIHGLFASVLNIFASIWRCFKCLFTSYSSRLATFILLFYYHIHRDAYTGRCPLCPHSWGAGGARVALRTELFPSLLSAEEAFSGIVDSLVQENFSGGKPPDPQIIVVLLEDQCIKHCSSGKEFKDQNLALWRNIYMHRFAFIGSLAPLP